MPSTATEMTDPTTIETVTQRLRQALDALDDAVERRLEAGVRGVALAEQVHMFEVDRSRLAAELDAMVARTRHLEATNRDIAKRLDHAIATIRSVIAEQDQGE